MQLAILGSGAIGLSGAALAATNGHSASLWTRDPEQADALASGINATGAISGHFPVAASEDMAEVLGQADVVMLCLPGYAHRAVIDRMVPLLTHQQAIIVSSEISFSGLYLQMQIAKRGLSIPVIIWGTTATTGRRTAPDSVWLNSVRQNVDLSTIPADCLANGMALCATLFGERFVARENALAIALSNVNPQNHLAIVLGNLTRMERGEVWGQAENVTPGIGRLMEALDDERLSVAAALDIPVKTVREHFHKSFHVPYGSVSDMNRAMHEDGRGGHGPATLDTRYVYEDVPFGLLTSALIGRICGAPMQLHEAGIDILSAVYGEDFRRANDLLDVLGLSGISAAALRTRLEQGVKTPGMTANS
ncbi:NAD/NADP octopine/nopaline dehydrogenase [Aureimonas fodinaquatilis]|uniref:NAD/NADP octopine/nopaline dehydrogenase n=1 Tax=Aureimonas fodinaquatilis TaxID=2565783 RepID=A0A5B0DXM1_9HYPH|nr:NAD/NADP octopine/nopaline dehydrogenase [Aureimonas fodinaquatilis]